MNKLSNIVSSYNEGNLTYGELISRLAETCLEDESLIQEVPEEHKTNVEELIAKTKESGWFWVRSYCGR